MRRSATLNITIVALSIAINMLGSLIAFNLRLPIYLDNIGTVMVAVLLGYKYAIASAALAGLVNGILFDVFAFYYAPTAIFTGIMASYVFRSKRLERSNIFMKALIVAIPPSMISAMITAYLFRGITSSGSTYLIQVLSKLGLDMVTSALVIQIFTDYVDKLVALLITITIIKFLPQDIVGKIRRGKNGSIQ